MSVAEESAQARLERVTATLRDTEKSRQTEQRCNASLERKVEAATNEIKELEALVGKASAAKASIAGLREGNAADAAAIADLQEKTTSAQRAHDAKMSKVTSATAAEVDKIETILETQRKEERRRGAAVDELQHARDELLADSEKEVNALQRDIDRIVSTRRERTEALQKNLKSLQNTQESSTNELESLREQQAEHVQERDALTAKLDAIKAELDAAEAKVAAALGAQREQASDLQSQLDTLGYERENLETEIAELRRTAETSISEQSEKITNLMGKQALLTAEISSSDAQIVSLTAEVDSMRQRYVAEREDRNSTLEALLEAIDEATTPLRTAKGKLERYGTNEQKKKPFGPDSPGRDPTGI